MIVLQEEVISVSTEQDTILVRNRIQEMSVKVGLGLVDQTKLITAASELFRNMLRYANGGKITVQVVSDMVRNGVQIIFIDSGPGIEDIDLAMKEGYSTGKSFGLGLSGSKKLVDIFKIKSVMGKGTTITITKWKNGRR